jgi:hypothetical protein
VTDAIDRLGSAGDVDRDGPEGPAAPGGPAADDSADAGAGTGTGGTGASPRPALVVAGLLAVLSVPLAVALGVLHHPRWYPLLDLAQTELRVRDVGTGHTPLVGLAGRIQAYGQQGSHPGPLSFWALRPVYTLLGSSPWALQAACVSLHVVAMGAILWVAHRRGGARLALALAATLAVLTHAYGPGTLTEAWNPYMPVLWWVLFLLAAWSVVEDDLPMLPVAVVAGSFCLQTHISYLGLVGGVAGLLVVSAGAALVVRRRDPSAVRPLLRWGGLAAAVGVVLWIPPLVDQLTNDPGNGSMIYTSFRHPSDPAIGVGTAGELLGVHLNPWRLLTGDAAVSGSVVPALGLLAVWAGTVVLAWRLRHRALLGLHAVVGVALALGLVSLSRVFGEVWYYLALWAWGIQALLLVAVIGTLAAAVSARGRWPVSRLGARGASRLATAALAAVLVVWAALFTVDASHAEVPAERQSRLLSRLAPDTVAALDAGVAGAGGREGRYLVTWTDPVALGASGFGLLLELERQGFDVGVPEFHGTGAVSHRVMAPDDATAEIHLAVGGGIAEWRDDPAAELVSEVDVRSPAERRRYDRLHAEIAGELGSLGLGDLVPDLDTALMAVVIDGRVPVDVRAQLYQLADLGQPAAVFVVPR